MVAEKPRALEAQMTPPKTAAEVAAEKLRDELASRYNETYKSVKRVECSGMSAWARSANAFKSGFDAALSHEKQRSAKLLEALRFYAENKNYDLSTCEVSDEKVLSGSFIVMKDEGKRARAALREYRGEG